MLLPGQIERKSNQVKIRHECIDTIIKRVNKEISKLGSEIQKDQGLLEILPQEARSGADAQILKDRIQVLQTDLTNRRTEINQLHKVREQLQSQSDELEDIRKLRKQGATTLCTHVESAGASFNHIAGMMQPHPSGFAQRSSL